VPVTEIYADHKADIDDFARQHGMDSHDQSARNIDRMTREWMAATNYMPARPSWLTQLISRIRMWLYRHGWGVHQLTDDDILTILARAAQAEVDRRGGSKVGNGTRFSIADRDASLKRLEGVNMREAIIKRLEDGIPKGEYRLKHPEDKQKIIDGAERFFSEFANKKIPLSNGRVAYFMPDKQAFARGEAAAWAEYCMHQVTSGGQIIPGKDYTERLFNHTKLENLDLIEPIIKQEVVFFNLNDKNPTKDSISFVGKTHDQKRMDIITRLDDYGNINANLTEVTFLGKGKDDETPPPKPLTEAVETVARHQAAGLSPSTKDNINASGEKSSGNGGISRASISPVYTGSAADYVAPSLHYVGSGEGAQVYGWGLYGSSDRGVAEWYAEKDVQHKRHPDVIWDGKPSDKFFRDLRRDGMPEKDKNRYWRLNDLNQILLDKKGDVDRVIEICRRNIEEAESFNQKDVVEENRERIKLLEEYRDKIRFHEGTQQSLSINGEKFVPGGNIVGKADWERGMIGFLFSTNGDVSRALQNVKMAIAHIESKIQEQGKEFETDFDRNSLADLNKAKEFLSDKSNKISYDDGTTGRRHLYKQTFWPGKQENLLDWDENIPDGQARQILDKLAEEGGKEVLAFVNREREDWQTDPETGDLEAEPEYYAPDVLRDYLDQFLDFYEADGEYVYKQLTDIFGSPKEASEFLYRAGIDGVTYIGDASGVRNYVAFSDKDIHVDEHIRYSVREFDPTAGDERAKNVVAMLRPLVGSKRSGFDHAKLAARIKEQHGVDVSPVEVAVWINEAIRKNAGERARNNAKIRNEWLYENNTLWKQAVDYAGSENFKVRVSERMKDRNLEGTFWLTKENEKSANAVIDLDALASEVARQTGRDALDVEQEFFDFFNGLTKSGLNEQYHQYRRDQSFADKEAERAAREEWAQLEKNRIADEVVGIIERGNPIQKSPLCHCRAH